MTIIHHKLKLFLLALLCFPVGCASSSSDLESDENLAIDNIADNDDFDQSEQFSQDSNQFNENEFSKVNNQSDFNQAGFSEQGFGNNAEGFTNGDFNGGQQGENNLSLNELPANNGSDFFNPGNGNSYNQAATDYNGQNLGDANQGYSFAETSQMQANQTVEAGSNAAQESPTNNVATKEYSSGEPVQNFGPDTQGLTALPATRMTWIGYDYAPNEKKVTLELVFDQAVVPKWQTVRDAFGQTEYQMLVPGAKAAALLHRDLDARQFYSPLSFIKVKDTSEGLLIVMTLRDDLQPEVLNDGKGGINLQFAIPDKYLNNKTGTVPGEVAHAEIIEDPQMLESSPEEEEPSESIPVNSEVMDENLSSDAELAPEELNGSSEEYLNPEPNGDAPEGSLEDDLINEEPSENQEGASLDTNSAKKVAVQNRHEIPFAIIQETRFFSVTVAQDFIENETMTNTGGAFGSETNNTELNPLGPNDGGFVENVGVSGQAFQSETNTSNGFDSSNPQNVEANHDEKVDLNQNLIESQDASNMAGGGIKGKALTLSFRGAPLNEVIRAIMGETGINFTMPPEIGKIPIYIEFKQVFWVDALKAILQTYNLGFVDIAPNLVRVDQLERLNSEKSMLEEIRRSTVRLTDTKILVVRLSYARAETVAPRVREILKADADIDPRVNISADNRTNSLYIEAIPVVLGKIKAIVEKLDLQTPQVKIESRIVEVIKTSGDFLGINWSQPFNYNAGRGLGFGSVVFPNSVTSSYSVDTGGSAPRVGNINLLVGSINNTTELDLRLAFEESKGTTEILESSSIIVQDSTEAKIKAGTKDYFRSNSIFDKESMATIEYFLTLAVTPNITSDGNVLMQLKVSSVNPRASQATKAEAGSTDREVETTLIRGSGETAAIGGLYTTNKVEKIEGIPFLSSIPIIGRLFKSVQNSESRRELVVLITPTIVNYAGKSAMINTSELVQSSGGGSNVLGKMGEGPVSQQYNNFNANQGNQVVNQQFQENGNQGNNNMQQNNKSSEIIANSEQQVDEQFNNFNNQGSQQNSGEFVGNQGQAQNAATDDVFSGQSNSNNTDSNLGNSNFGDQGLNSNEFNNEGFSNEEF